MSACADCGEQGPIMVVMKPGRGPARGEWFLCSGCFRASLVTAEQDRKERAAKLAARDAKQRQTHNRERVGSH
jgi:hypothetical protein